MTLDTRLRTYVERVDRRLEELLPPESDEPVGLHKAMRYSALAPGKRIRPILCMASAEAVGGSAESALDAASAMELIHSFSLIHDDLPAIDDDDLRRGRPTCHKVFGEGVAILAGDALFALAMSVLAGMGAPTERRTTAMQAATEAIVALVRGEVLDVVSEGEVAKLEKVRLIHDWKTGALIQAACSAGASLGGADAAQIAALTEYGRWIGLAFQIADDILNETSTVEELGKAAGSDRGRNKMTYPAAIGLAASRAASREHAEKAKQALTGIPKPDLLVDLADFTIERTK